MSRPTETRNAKSVQIFHRIQQKGLILAETSVTGTSAAEKIVLETSAFPTTHIPQIIQVTINRLDETETTAAPVKDPLNTWAVIA